MDHKEALDSKTTSDAHGVEAALLQAQMTAYARQMPLLYLALGVSIAMIALSHWTVAPIGLTVLIPAMLFVFIALRLSTWIRRLRRGIGLDEARRISRSAIIIAPAASICFLFWALALFFYGDAVTHMHLIFFCGFAATSSVFCQLHLRSVALAAMAVTAPPFILFLLLTGDAALVAIGVDMAIVSVLVVRMLFVHSRSFGEMISLQIGTERLSRETRDLAFVDSLTGLGNRRSFFERLETALATEASRSSCVIGLIDLDGFKQVNDLHGHAAGDRVLVEVGRRLRSLEAERVSFARLGGDEFAVFVGAALDRDSTTLLGRRVCETLSSPYWQPGLMIELSASMGFATSREETARTQGLYERADYALNHAKQNRRGGAVMFSEEHETAIRRAGLVEQALRRADLASELSLLFQPMVDLAQGRTVAFEALARWRSPELGEVSPGEFIPIAERTDLVNRLTRTLLVKALDAAAEFPAGVRVSFNLSTRDLGPDAILRILGLVRASGVAPERISFEITETAAMRDFAMAEGAFAALRTLGSRISLDDFGSGYSSLTSVRRLILDDLKIDRGFSVDIENDQTARDVVKVVIDLCRNLKLRCIVEGVETEGQLRILRSLGCSMVQGYLYARPLAPDAIASYLEDEAWGGRASQAIAQRTAAAAAPGPRLLSQPGADR